MMKTILVSILIAGCGSVSPATDKTGEPVINSIQPDHGGIPGGTMVTIMGSHLNKGTPQVVIGGHLATMVGVSNDVELTFMTPPGDQGGAAVDVAVANDNGFALKEQGFTYNLEPVVLSVSPAIGKSTGGTNVTITGRGFQDNDAGTPTITIGGAAATNVMVVDDKTITATTAAAASGTPSFTPTDVTVANANGTSVLANSFTLTSQGLIVVDRQFPSEFFHVDLATGKATKIGSSTSRRIAGCVMNPATGQLFAQSRNVFTSFHELVTFDPLTGTSTLIGGLDDSSSNSHGIGAMAFVGNTLYGIDAGRSYPGNTQQCRLVTINTSTGAVTAVGASQTTYVSCVPNGNGGGAGAGIAPKDANNVYYASRSNGSLDSIAIADSTKTTGLAYSGGDGTSNPIVAMTVVNGMGYLLERASPGAIIWQVNLQTAALTKFATVSTPALAAGMCQTPPSY